MGQINPLEWDIATADTIRAERAAAQMSQAQLAKKAGIPRTTYIRYETGERTPNIAQVAAIAEALDLRVSVFMRRIEDRVRTSL